MAKFRRSVERNSPRGVQGRSPDGGLGQSPPEAEKHDIKFALRITLVHAYCPFYSSCIMTFVIRFSRSSHVSHFQSLLYSSPTPTATPYYVLTLLIGFARISGSSLGTFALSSPPVATVMNKSNSNVQNNFSLWSTGTTTIGHGT